MNYLIRKATHQDAKDIIHVHAASITEICAKDYTSEEIKAWSCYLAKESIWCQRMDRDHIWVLDIDNKVYGFAHLAVMNEDLGEVMGLYLAPEVKDKGYGRKLIELVVEFAVALHLKHLALISTKTAKKFYERMGFLQNESDTTVEINGVPIACHPMKLDLFLLSSQS